MDQNYTSNVSYIHGSIGTPSHGFLKLENDIISLINADTQQVLFNESIDSVKEIIIMKELNFKLIFKSGQKFIISGVDWGNKKFLKSYYLKFVIPFAVIVTIIGYSGYKARTSSNVLYVLPVLIPIVGSLMFRKYLKSTDDYSQAVVDDHAQDGTPQFILDKDVVEQWTTIFSSYNMRIVIKNY